MISSYPYNQGWLYQIRVQPEPVGSCTDPAATVSYPLRRMYGDHYTIAPLSVLVDPIRARRILGLDTGPSFSPKVRYVFEKQLEEAEIIVINKCDLLDEARCEKLKEKLIERFHPRQIVVVSARQEIGLTEWFETILHTEITTRTAMELDYETYADGEVLLGRLNATIRLSSSTEFNGNDFTMQLARRVQELINPENIEIAYLKMTLIPDISLGDIATVNLVRSDFSPEISEKPAEPLNNGQLIVNLRAEAKSARLKEMVLDALNGHRHKTTFLLEHIEHFQPSKPNPTHRIIEPV